MIDMRVGKERTIGYGAWSRVALLLTRGGATSIYTVGRTEKKTTKERERERKKRKNDVTRESYTHWRFLRFPFVFQISLQHANIRARDSHSGQNQKKKKKKKQVTSPLSTRIWEKNERIQIYLAFLLRRFLVNIFLLIIA